MDDMSSTPPRKQTNEEFLFALECKENEFIFAPVSYLRKKKTKKKPKKKQMTLKAGLKNMKEKNFQGYDIERCTFVPSLGKHVFIPKSYGGKTRKMYKSKEPEGCPRCNLAPCSSIEFQGELAGLCRSVDNWSLPEDGVLDKLRTRYRVLFAKHFGKTFMIKSMPQNDRIPKCALEATQKLVDVEIGDGYDSLVEDSPFARDRKLNARDNWREVLQYEVVVAEEGTAATTTGCSKAAARVSLDGEENEF